MTGSPPRLARGFTLVELLLTISLVALVLIEAGSVFNAASASYRGCRADGERRRQAEAALSLIGRDVARLTCAGDGVRPSVVVVSAIGGGSNSLLRLRTEAPATPGGRAAMIDYFLAPDTPDGPVLARRCEWVDDGVARSGSPAGQGPSVTWESAAADAAGFTVRAFDGAAWSEDVSGAAVMLIEVTLEIARPSGSTESFRRCFEVPVGEPFDATAGGGI